MCDCRKCFHFKVCKKAEHVENYKLQGECGEFVDEDRVIVPTVKVGQTVYAEVINRVEGFVVTNFHFDVTTTGTQYGITSHNGRYPMLFSENNIGKTVFLTKEEAEQALSKLQASYEQVKEGEQE